MGWNFRCFSFGKDRSIWHWLVDLLKSNFTNDLNRIGHGSAQYNLLCDESGGVIDDLIIYRYNEDRFLLVPNAANCATVFAVLESANDMGLTIKNAHHDYGVLAVQGPKSKELLTDLGVILDLDYMAFTEVTIPGYESLGSIIICRTGYTGEFGYELIPSWNSTLPLWEVLVATVQKHKGRVCGLGARDTLRTEMGYPLHGHELSLDISPLQANAGWAVALGKPHFHGHNALVKEKADGVSRILRGLIASDRGIPRGGMNVMDSHGNVVGEVTSGTFSPTLKIGIGLALIKPDIALETELSIDVRGRTSLVKVVKPPFVPSHVR
ncbi:MAG: glycine cleavage system aminomethyltransferase GcvT [Actinomycetota bacterium]